MIGRSFTLPSSELLRTTTTSALSTRPCTPPGSPSVKAKRPRSRNGSKRHRRTNGTQLSAMDTHPVSPKTRFLVANSARRSNHRVVRRPSLQLTQGPTLPTSWSRRRPSTTRLVNGAYLALHLCHPRACPEDPAPGLARSSPENVARSAPGIPGTSSGMTGEGRHSRLQSRRLVAGCDGRRAGSKNREDFPHALHRHGRRDVRVGLVSGQFEIVVLEIEDRGHERVQLHVR